MPTTCKPKFWMGSRNVGRPNSDTSARTIIDFVAFDAANPKSAFNQATTNENNISIYLREADGLYSRSDELLMTFISDGFRGLGTHDLQIGMCGRARHRRAAEEGRLNEYLHGDGGMKRTQVRPGTPVEIVLRAEKELSEAFSACPDIASRTGGLGVGVLISD